MGENEKIFTEEQIEMIYTDMLKPLKVKISEILLYDTKAAMDFLQKYNEILECTNEKQILTMITTLEFEIASYEKSIGNQKSFEDKSETIIQQIKDMQTGGDNLSVEDFEKEFLRLKQTYKRTSLKYGLKDKDTIEQQLYELYGRLMVRRVKEGATDEVEISKEDEVGLRIFLNKEIGKLLKSANPQAQNTIERIKFKLMDEETAFQGDEIWQLLSLAQKQENIGVIQQTLNPQPAQMTALAVRNQKKDGIFSRIKKLFQKEPELPLQVDDIKKITIEWLSQYIPKSMLEEIENQRLSKEGENPEKRYIPYPQTAIHHFFAGKLNIDGVQVKYDNSDKGEFKYEYDFVDNYGNKQTLIFESELSTYMSLISEYLDGEKEQYILVNSEREAKVISLEILNYAIFLDKVLNTNLTSILLNHYMEAIKEKKSFDDFVSIQKLFDNSKIFRNLYLNYNSMKEECERIENALMGNEQEARRKFYEKTAFKDSLRITGDYQAEIPQQVSDLNKKTDIEKSQQGEAK